MFDLIWTQRAKNKYNEKLLKARQTTESRRTKQKTKASKQEGVFKQIQKTLQLLSTNPKHPGLQTHEYYSVKHPFSPEEKVFEAYVQNRTPGAYRIFWCYGPNKKQITILDITPHP